MTTREKIKIIKLLEEYAVYKFAINRILINQGYLIGGEPIIGFKSTFSDCIKTNFITIKTIIIFHNNYIICELTNAGKFKSKLLASVMNSEELEKKLEFFKDKLQKILLYE